MERDGLTHSNLSHKDKGIGMSQGGGEIIVRIVWVATAKYPATIVLDCTCTHTLKEQEMCKNKSTQVAEYSAVKPVRVLYLCYLASDRYLWQI